MKFNFTLLTLKREITPKNDQKSLGLIQKKFSTAFGGRHRKKKGTPKKYNTPTRKKVEAEQQSSRRGTIIFSGIFDELPRNAAKRETWYPRHK